MKKKLEELNVLDDFLFGTLASHPVYSEPFARILVKTILNRDMKIVKIVPQMQYYGKNTNLHGARLDVYIEEEDDTAEGNFHLGSMYDIEPDHTRNREDRQALPRRVRFYRSVIDNRNLQSGADYSQLKNVIIIILTSYDPFGYDRRMYTVRNTCLEEPSLQYDDGAINLFLYTRGKRGTVSQGLKELLYYLEHSDWKNAVNDSLKEIQTMVDNVKQDEEVAIVFTHALERWYAEMLKYDSWEEGKELGHELGREEGLELGREEGRELGLELGREEGRELGLELGREEGRELGRIEALADSINDMLSDLGTVPKNITTQISNERDLNVLSRWLKLAARSKSLNEFIKKM